MVLGWIIAALMLALLCGVLAWRNRGTPPMLFASMALFALAGYGVTGTPGLTSSPIKPPPEKPLDIKAMENSEALMFVDRFAPSARWMAMANSFAMRGKTEQAAGLLVSGLREYPKDPELWVMLGNVLLQHSGDVDAPAVRYAYDQARALRPDAPSLLYADGIIALSKEDFAGAEKAWSAMLAAGPKNAAWRSDMETLLGLVRKRMADMPPASPASAPATAGPTNQ